MSAVNHPEHYQGSIECIDAIASSLSPEELRGFIKANAIKYLWREQNKGGTQDLEKALWYLNWYLNHLKNNGDGQNELIKNDADQSQARNGYSVMDERSLHRGGNSKN